MPVTRPIPEEAMPAVEFIRRWIPRPRQVPRVPQRKSHERRLDLCWDYNVVLWEVVKMFRPSGLRVPGRAFGMLETWFEEQRSGKLAMLALWGPEEAAP